MNQFKESCQKLMNVVASCNTREQAKSAWAYYLLWTKKYPLEDIPKPVLGLCCFTDGYARGCLDGLSKFEWIEQIE